MKPSVEIHPPIKAWITRFLDWNFFERPVRRTTELGAVEGQDYRHMVQSVRARRVTPLNENKGEILVTLENYPDAGKDPGLKADLKRRVSEKGRIVKSATVLMSGNLLFTFNCASSERTGVSPFATDFLVYKRDESKYLFEAVDAVGEVFEILGIDGHYLRYLKLCEETLVLDDGTWVGLEKFLRRAKGLPE